MKKLIVVAAVAGAAAVPVLGQQRKIPDVLKKTPPPVAVAAYDPARNRALLFGWTGAADTALQLDSFFDADHTVMAWFMPQYTRAYVGPVLGNTGSGIYAVGQGSFYNGNGSSSGGDPALTVGIGNAIANYVAKDYTAGQWHHLAVVRQAGLVRLYLDGVRLTPVAGTDIVLGASFANKPRGALRFGRSASLENAQAFGMIDDVAVFSRALSAQDIAAYRAQRRFTGWEPGLLRAWTFDDTPALQRAAAVTRRGRTFKVPVKGAAADGFAVASPLFLGSSEAVKPRLPFAVNEVWRVTQGSDSPAPSHHDASAFSYDFVRATGNSVGVTLVNSAEGRIAAYNPIGKDSSGALTEGNLTLELGNGIYVMYGHLGSLTSKATGGTPKTSGSKTRFHFETGKGPLIKAGEFIGTVGPNQKHLHMDGNPGPGTGLTIPLAYFEYEASDDQGKTWKKVLKGTPRKGQWIRRVQ